MMYFLHTPYFHMRLVAFWQFKPPLSMGESGWLWWTVHFFWLFLTMVRDCGWGLATLPHEDFNGPNTLSVQIKVESLMQFWPDFDAAAYWCGVTPQQGNKVRSLQWLKWSSWEDVYILCLQACREATGNSIGCLLWVCSSCLYTDRKGKRDVF